MMRTLLDRQNKNESCTYSENRIMLWLQVLNNRANIQHFAPSRPPLLSLPAPPLAAAS